MGQVQSEAVDEAQTQSEPQHSSSSPASSMESLLAEAAAYGDDENESLDAKAQKALECPCIADLRKGPCGEQFSEAFLCFLKSTSEEKGSDCVHPFVALQNCIKANPNAFSKDILDEDEDEVKKEEEPPPSPTYKIYPPLWSRGPQSPKSKL
ncbi:mitochondrial intermembrane space import and assembly protein 40 homolog [Pistacia vera]|uniref:mitochondrial intermembrane space import and assembly protein 40 homolog n=1 Tax=Pistacia vera TaxID=55513 RepID=UPI001262E250|nr:mitochondrial intermembrane space import and assembly protein 40 homolog [Pistacia vera]